MVGAFRLKLNAMTHIWFFKVIRRPVVLQVSMFKKTPGITRPL